MTPEQLQRLEKIEARVRYLERQAPALQVFDERIRHIEQWISLVQKQQLEHQESLKKK